MVIVNIIIGVGVIGMEKKKVSYFVYFIMIFVLVAATLRFVFMIILFLNPVHLLLKSSVGWRFRSKVG